MGYLNEDGLATLVGKVKGQVVQLTSAEYRNLPASKNSDNKTYFVTDEDYAYAIDDEPTLNSDNLVKSGGVYTYTSKIGSGTLTTTAQTIIPAINELKAGLNNLSTRRTGTLTANSGVTLSGEYIAKYGNIAYLTCIVKVTENKNSYTRLVEIPEGFVPLRQTFAGECDITTSGAIRNRVAATANQEFTVTAMYIVP